jgi:hypothetical protein
MMMHRAIAGLLLFALLAPSGANAGLYTDVQAIVREEAAITIAEPIVRHFAAFIAGAWERDINPLLQADVTVCAEQCVSDEGIRPCQEGDPRPALRDAMTSGRCDDLTNAVQRMVAEEEWIRSTGRQMQAAAFAQEQVIEERPEDPDAIAAHLEAIVGVWAPGGETVNKDDEAKVDDRRMRVVPIASVLPPAQVATVQDTISEVDDALTALRVTWMEDPDGTGPQEPSLVSIDERQTAAVWRYRFGVRFARGDREPQFPPPVVSAEDATGERQYVGRRWTAVETALLKIWSLLPRDPQAFSPPLGRDEVAVFALEQPGLASARNVEVWARVDGNGAEDHPFGDVGLRWIVAGEPVLPSLLTDAALSCVNGCNGDAVCAALCGADGNGVILGGEYPPEPEDGTGLCSQPLASRGALCRPMTMSPGGASPCEESPDPQTGAVILTKCDMACPRGRNDDGTCIITAAGPDVCAASWDAGVIEPATACRVELQCDTTCPLEKTSEGIVNVCIPADSTLPGTYALLLALAHAGTACHVPPGTPLIPEDAPPDVALDACCSREQEAFRVACQAMATDGVFTDLPPVDGVPVTAQTCAEAMADRECSEVQELGHCPSSWEYPSSFAAYIAAAAQRNPASVPASCTEAMNEETRDARVAGAIAQLDDGGICTPGRVTTYRNSVGNNLCYLGKCIEQGWETHAVIGGRQPLSVGDGIAPVTSLFPEDDAAARVAPPAPGESGLPPYLPGALLAALEQSLCAANGLPALLPPSRCGFDVRRAIVEGGGDPLAIGASAFGQSRELLQGTAHASMAQAMGIRASSDAFARYMTTAAAPLAGVLRSAADLLSAMTTVQFPVEMCPLGPA